MSLLILASLVANFKQLDHTHAIVVPLLSALLIYCVLLALLHWQDHKEDTVNPRGSQFDD